ncbi:MAG TPA: hypothetical protein VLG46_11225 [Anaerolineae bacterium]|nr:hypothetical protein [Anaerolineae bacterium]
MKPVELNIWLNRWSALDSSLAEVIGNISGSEPRLVNLHALAMCLRGFAGQHFKYFYEGFNNASLKPSKVHPAEEVFRVILDQVASDLEVIERAASPIFLSSAAMHDTLIKAEGLAVEALSPAKSLGLDPLPTVITYFEKSPAIRLVPYANVALVAVPFSAVKARRDLLAIPHEVGHCVFRHWYKPEHIACRNPFPTVDQWCRNWVEEIFADAYGCLVAGPLIALDFQDLQCSDSDASFMSEDGHHPAPRLRPEVYTAVLDKIVAPVGPWDPGWSVALKNRWDSLSLARTARTQLHLERADPKVGLHVSLSDARLEVTKVIDRLFDNTGLRSTLPSAKWQAACPAAPPTPVETIYDDFGQWIDPPDGKTPSSPDQPELACTSWDEKISGMLGEPVAGLKQPVDPDLWELIWAIEDWITVPPENYWP